MNPASLFFAALIVGAPATVFGVMAMIFDWGILDFPGFVYITFGAATLSALVMLGVVLAGNLGFLILFAIYIPVYIPFLLLAMSWITKDIEAHIRERMVPIRPWEGALLAENRGELAEAARRYANYCDACPQDSDALRHYAGCLLKMGRHESAVAIHRRIFSITKGPLQITAGLEVAYICEKHLRDHEAAEAEIKSLRDYFAQTDLAKKFEQELKRLRIRISGDPRPFEEKVDLA